MCIIIDLKVTLLSETILKFDDEGKWNKAVYIMFRYMIVYKILSVSSGFSQIDLEREELWTIF